MSSSLSKRVAAALLVGVLTLPVGLDSVSAAAPPEYQGRRLVDVLQELQSRGLRLIFSSAVVGEDLRVTVEPSAKEPRALLEEILEPLGLRIEDGPGGSILILPRGLRGGAISGRVLSATRGTPIVRASIRLQEAGQSTFTGPDGTFEISPVPFGTYVVIFEALGFSPTILSRVHVTAEADAELTVLLQAQPMFVTEVVVTPGRHSLIRQEQAASHTLTREDAVLAPTIGGDISRVIELLPGVAAPDTSAAFNVRGSIAEDVSILLDGLELYDPFHLQSFHSPFSLIDANVVDRIEFFGGGFTANLGDRHGGFVEITSFVPGDSPRGELELGTLNSRFSYRSPISFASGSWLVSARGWYPEALFDTIELGGPDTLDPRFGDVYAKASFAPSSRHLVSAHGLLSYDRVKITETDKDEKESVNALTRNGYIWFRALSAWSDTLSSETLLSGGRIERIRDGLSASEDESVEVDDGREINFVGFKHDAKWQIAADHIFKAGLEVRKLDAEYKYLSEFSAEPAASQSIGLDPEGTSLGVYAAYRTRVSQKLATEFGFRWDRQSYTGDNQLSPRFNAIWKAGERSELRLALGRFQQSQRIHELNIEDGDTTFRPAEVSEQAEASFLHGFPGGLKFRVDAYYRKLSDLRPRYENLFEPIELFPETSEDRLAVFPREARLRGLEVMLQGDASRPLFWWASYAASSAEDLDVSYRLSTTDEIIDGPDAPRSWDQTHAGKFLFGYRWDDRWTLSMSGSVHTGWPTTPVSAVRSSDGSFEVEPIVKDRNSDRFPTYARLDVKARRAFSLPRGRLWLTLEVVNLTDQENECCVGDFLVEPRGDGTADVEREFDSWLGITPSFSVLWEF
jgi:hypothetical protein